MGIFRKPTERKVGLKVLVTGNTGSGKSVFGLSFPNTYALDSEAGLARYEGNEIGKNLLGIANTQSFKELENGIKEINKMVKSKDHGIGTLLIDSESKFYQNLQETCMTIEENKARKNGRDIMDANLSMRSWGKIRQISTKLQNMKIDLSTKGINVVSIAQVEDVKEKQGDNFVKVGEKPVANKNIEYDYDIIVNLFTEESNGLIVYKGEIKKDRTGKTKVGDILENPSYDVWEDINKTGKIVESDFQSDVEKDIIATEKEEEETLPKIENIDVLVDKIKFYSSEKEKKKEIVAYLKSKGSEKGLSKACKITDLSAEELNELIEKLK
ncbi:AAA family ATPase [Paraclostridium sordellii]|uniref:AAA family ATPase n=1 Tax=Paraclostridium sordellii TaxID=1505 RepID=UPI0022E49F7B|nr:AAA family ATPase [Paeniclostridium sordellii]